MSERVDIFAREYLCEPVVRNKCGECEMFAPITDFSGACLSPENVQATYHGKQYVYVKNIEDEACKHYEPCGAKVVEKDAL